ncbi:transmembrane channel 5, partial [Brachionus plicatilis]
IIKLICWEAEIGKQIYIFILFDFVLGIIDLIFSSIYLFCVKSEVVFDNSYYTINTLFSYLILWTGLYFSPYLGTLFIIFYIILFIVRAIVVKKLYKPSAKAQNVSHSETYVIMTTLFSIFLAILILGGISFGLKSSKTCGPFNDEKLQRPYDYLIAFQNYLYE